MKGLGLEEREILKGRVVNAKDALTQCLEVVAEVYITEGMCLLFGKDSEAQR